MKGHRMAEYHISEYYTHLTVVYLPFKSVFGKEQLPTVMEPLLVVTEDVVMLHE